MLNGRLFTAMVADAKSDKANNRGDNQEYEAEEPNRAENNVFYNGRDFVVVINGLLYFDDAEYWEVVDITIDVAGGFRHDNFGETVVLVFVGREDFFAGDGITDIKCDNGGFVDVAVIVEQSANRNRGGSREFWNVILKNGAIVGNFAGDVGIYDAGKGKDVINRNAFGFLLGWVGRYHDGGVLAAGGGIFGNSDREFYFAGFVGGNGAGGLGNGDPFSDFGISRDSRNIGLIIFTNYIIWGNRNRIGKVAGRIDRINDSNGASSGFTWVNGEILAHR